MTDYEAMALKTVIRRSARYLPMSTETQEAVAADETTPDYSGVFNPIIEPPAPQESAQEPDSDAQMLPVGVNPTTGEIEANNASGDPDIADEDMPWPNE